MRASTLAWSMGAAACAVAAWGTGGLLVVGAVAAYVAWCRVVCVVFARL